MSILQQKFDQLLIILNDIKKELPDDPMLINQLHQMGYHCAVLHEMLGLDDMPHPPQ